MQTFNQSLQAFSPIPYGFNAPTFTFGDNNEYELVFEKLLFDNQWYVALYKNKQLLINKVVIKPGK